MKRTIALALLVVFSFAPRAFAQTPSPYVGQPVVQMIQTLGQPTATTDVGNGVRAMTFRQKRKRRTYDGTAIVDTSGLVQSYSEKEIKPSTGQKVA